MFYYKGDTCGDITSLELIHRARENIYLSFEGALRPSVMFPLITDRLNYIFPINPIESVIVDCFKLIKPRLIDFNISTTINDITRVYGRFSVTPYKIETFSVKRPDNIADDISISFSTEFKINNEYVKIKEYNLYALQNYLTFTLSKSLDITTMNNFTIEYHSVNGDIITGIITGDIINSVTSGDIVTCDVANLKFVVS